MFYTLLYTVHSTKVKCWNFLMCLVVKMEKKAFVPLKGKRRKRVFFDKDSPFPVPIESVSGEAAHSTKWSFYTGKATVLLLDSMFNRPASPVFLRNGNKIIFEQIFKKTKIAFGGIFLLLFLNVF